MAWDLNYRAGSILIEQQEWTAAIATLRPLQQGPADAARRGQAHLLACFTAGRRLDALTQSTAANAPSAAGHPVNPERKLKADDREVTSARELYLTLLQEHRQQFPDQPSHAEATWMLARLAEQQQNWTDARQLYAEIPLTHPKAILALSGLSRVLHRQLLTDRAQSYRGAVSRTDTDSAGDGIPSPQSNPIATSTTSNSSSTASNNTWTASMRAESIQELERRLQPWLSGPDAIGTEAAASAESCDRQLVVAEAALVLAELRLSAVEPDFPAIEKSLGAVTQLPRLENPVLSAEEEAQATRQHPAVNYAHRWQQLLWRATQLRIVALAAQGEIELARDQLQTLAQASPDELLAILAGLDQLRNLTATNPKADLSVLELDAAQQLHRQRDRLTPAQQIALDERRANAFFRTGDLLSAQALYEELLKSRPQDAQLLRPYAHLLSRSRSNDARSRALGIWKKLEQQQRAGSTEWLEIRAEVISLLIEMQDQPAALKLLKVTRTLYPKAGSPQLQQRFKELEARCQPADAKSRSDPIPKDKPGRK